EGTGGILSRGSPDPVITEITESGDSDSHRFSDSCPKSYFLANRKVLNTLNTLIDTLFQQKFTRYSLNMAFNKTQNRNMELTEQTNETNDIDARRSDGNKADLIERLTLASGLAQPQQNGLSESMEGEAFENVHGEEENNQEGGFTLQKSIFEYVSK
ncbi:18205_t:CDS:2, partial [Gigaspora margarita]